MRSSPNYVGGFPSRQDSAGIVPDVNIGSLKFQTIRDPRELENLRPIWKSWPGTRDSDLDVLSSAVRSRGNGCRPHVIVLARNARPDAILIGLSERKKIPVKLGHITICQPEVNVLEFVHGGLRGATSTENCIAILRQVMRSLDQGEADLALLKQLDVRSPLYSSALKLQPFLVRDCFHCDARWLMNFPKGLDAFLSSLCRSQRSKLRRKYKKLLDYFVGRLEVRQFRSVADLETAISAIEGIARKSDKRRRFGWGFSDTPQIREQMAVAAEKGWLRIYVLYLEDKPAAFWMGTLYDRSLQADHVGYDPAWSEFSPGIFLLLTILEDLRDADIETVDFGAGSSQLKRCLGAMPQAESRVHIYARTLRGVQLRMLLAPTCRAISVIRRTHCLEWVRGGLWNQLSRKRPK